MCRIGDDKLFGIDKIRNEQQVDEEKCHNNDIDTALSIAPDNGYVLRDLAKYKVATGDNAGASEDYQKAITWFKQFGEPHEQQVTEVASKAVAAPIIANVSGSFSMIICVNLRNLWITLLPF